MAITTASQSQLGQDTAKNSQIVTTSVRLINSGGGAAAGPNITSIIVTDSGYNTLDDTAAATSNSYIRILGTGFQSTANVFLNGTMVPKANVTFVSSTELRAVLPVSNTGNYALGVFNSNSAGALYSSSFVISTMPQWLTSATLANTAANTAFSTTLSATSDSSVTYSNTTALPAGTTLASNGYFSGTISTGVLTTYSFDVKATDAENQDSTRTFSVTVTVGPSLGQLYTWGANDQGQLGLNDLTYRSSPTQVGTGTDWSSIKNGPGPAILAKKTNGTLWAWGNGLSGKLGTNDQVYRSSPVQIGTNTNWNKFAIGINSSVATKTDGTLWTWGTGIYGALGNNNRNNDYFSPIQVGANQTWNDVALYYQSVFSIKTDGTLWSWGENNSGQLGINNRTYRSSPTQVGTGTNWSKISTFVAITAAIKTDGTLWTWGTRVNGVQGLNDNVYRSSPTQVGTGTTWSAVEIGSNHCLAIKTDGTLWGWGLNNSGQLGLNDTVSRSSPVQIGTTTNWSKIAPFGNASSALKTDGTLWTWGTGAGGRLGTNDTVSRSSPVQIGTNSWTTLQAASGSAFTIA
jgi:hypothetical protein